MNCFTNHFPLHAVKHSPVITAFDLVFAGHFLIIELKKKGGKLGEGVREKGILFFPDLLGKGYIFKAHGQASCWEWTHQEVF